MNEDRRIQQRYQSLRVDAPIPFQQLEQIDDLMVTPVPNVGPRVIRSQLFPFAAVLGQAIRVVAVGGCRVHEAADHGRREIRERHGQRFPVLENVTPIALIVWI